MAVTKTLTRAIPFEKNGKVEKWTLEMTYENDSEGDATYYKNTFLDVITTTDKKDNVVFTPKAKAGWTKAELIALCPTARWDGAFAGMVDSVITNPTVIPVADKSFTIPE